MAISAEHPHVTERVDTSGVSISGSRPLSMEESGLKVHLGSVDASFHGSVAHGHACCGLSPASHLRVVHVETLISILDDERVLHRVAGRGRQLSFFSGLFAGGGSSLNNCFLLHGRLTARGHRAEGALLAEGGGTDGRLAADGGATAQGGSILRLVDTGHGGGLELLFMLLVRLSGFRVVCA